MKLIDEMDAQKLRGGFYTPNSVVKACLDRVRVLLKGSQDDIKMLEPSAGDGAFARGIGRLRREDRLRRADLTCVEVVAEEASACRSEMEAAEIAGEVINDSFFRWIGSQRGTFNAVVGNPPFLRYQFVPEEDRRLAEWLFAARGHALHGVSNYWIPFVLLSLDLLPPGGAFSLVLPSELLSTVSAGQVRAELVRNFDQLRVDLYPRSTFPDILQDVLVLSGVRHESPSASRLVSFSEHGKSEEREWSHQIGSSGESWTRFLLSTSEWDAFEAVKTLPEFHQLKKVATVSVAIVTGANDYFTVDATTLKEYGLRPWAKPLLGRTADSPGLIFSKLDHKAAADAGKKGWLLDFSDKNPDPTEQELPAEYLRIGRSEQLHTRFKCRIRKPWYRVPHIRRGQLMMAKRSHQHHRLLLNEAVVYTTDTIYRGDMTPEHTGRERDLVAGFHNTVTMLSAEIEGRTYGGGVLELVPSEVSRLIVPLVKTGSALTSLDALSRKTGGQRDENDSVIGATDDMLASRIPGIAPLLAELQAGRARLRDRRFFG